ncbi:MAG: DUF262 domain-containing protein [Ktedonobacteraceae bacterium]
MEGGDKPADTDDLAPYFLGSIVLIKGDEPEAQVIDGQQRLTTLTMLLAAIRSLISTGYAESLTSFLCEKGNIITGTPERYRLRLRERDAAFFQKYVQEKGGIEALQDLQDAQLPESQRNIRANTLGFIRELQKLSDAQLTALTQFIINRCFLIVVAVSSPDLDAVYRIFAVLNSRGLNLSYPDILKADLISTFPSEKQDEYATKWEEMETMLGSEEFESLFFHLRAIFSKKRQSKGMIEEFKQYVRPRFATPQDFIDNILFPYAHAYNNILKTNYQQGSPTKAKEISAMFRWLNYLDHAQWVPPALYYFVKNHRKQPDLVLRFLADLERLVISFMVCRVPPYRRIDRYCQLLHAIDEEVDLFNPESPLQLTSRERLEFLKMLDGDIYLLHYPCRYVLLRLDTKLSEKVASYDHQTVTIEHVLPQRPSLESEWVKAFPSREIRQKYVNRLGNLVLLSQGKNMKAENFDFEDKKQKYFLSKDGISPFALTTQVLSVREWKPTTIEQRQSQLITALKQLWRL